MPVDAEPKICGRCLKRAKVKEAEYCSRCLAEVIEKRVKRKLSPIKGGSGKPGRGRIVIACGSEASLSCAVAAYLAKKLCRAAVVSVIKLASLSGKIQQPSSTVIIPECADDMATSFVERITANSRCNTNTPDAAGAISIFESVTEKELELYAAIKKIKYRRRKSGRCSCLRQKILELQAKYPGTIEALAKSGRKIGEL